MDYAVIPVPNVETGQTISTSTTSAQSAALKASDYCCVVSAITYVARGTNPTATTSWMPLAPNTIHILRGIQENEKLAFILGSGTGTVSICPIT